jgi:hypothetical protein
MDDQRWEPGMPILDRQPSAESSLPPSLRGLPPRSVPETKPTPLQKHYVLLSTIPLVCGAIAITALELGAAIASPIVRIPVLLGTPILLVTTADATIRIWRSAWAWMDVDRGRGLFRLSWVIAAVLGMAAIAAGAFVVLTA